MELCPNDFVNIEKLIEKIKSDSSPVSKFLKTQIILLNSKDVDLEVLLVGLEHNDPISKALLPKLETIIAPIADKKPDEIRSLVQDNDKKQDILTSLNKIITQNLNLYAETNLQELFPDQEETKKILSQLYAKQEIEILNRFLLEHAYPAAIKRFCRVFIEPDKKQNQQYFITKLNEIISQQIFAKVVDAKILNQLCENDLKVEINRAILEKTYPYLLKSVQASSGSILRILHQCLSPKLTIPLIVIVMCVLLFFNPIFPFDGIWGKIGSIAVVGAFCFLVLLVFKEIISIFTGKPELQEPFQPHATLFIAFLWSVLTGILGFFYVYLFFSKIPIGEIKALPVTFLEILMLSGAWGMIGASVYNIAKINKHEAEFDQSMLCSYLLRPVTGVAFGIIGFLLFFSTDILKLSVSGQGVNLTGFESLKPIANVCVISMLCGFGSQAFFEKLSAVSKVTFGSEPRE